MLDFLDILKAQSGIPVEDPYAMLWGKALSGPGYTIKTLTGVPPLEFNSAGEPLIDWFIKGQTVQASTPTPANPVDVNGVGEEADSLFDIDTVVLGKYIDANGVEKTSAASIAVNKLNHTDYIKILPNTDYTFTYSSTAIPTINTVALCWFDSQKQLISRTTKNVSGKNYYINGTSPSTAVYCIINFIGYYETSVYQFNEDGTTPPYYKIPVTCGVTTNINLGSATSTRRVKKLVLTGTETGWTLYQLPSGGTVGIYQFYINENIISGIANSSCRCTITPYGITPQNRGNYLYGAYLVNSGRSVALQMKGSESDFPTVDTFKAYLQQQYANGTPVTVWYVLATPETAVVNEPLMKIGDYADEITKTGTGVEIPTTNGSNTLSVDTTVQPSEMSITYKGK